MSTPHDPGNEPAGGQGPQDPADPQNPYGAPPPSGTPASPIPPAAPVYGTEPPADQPPADQPPPPAPQAPDAPAYGAPAVPPVGGYSQPGYAEAPPPEQTEPGKGMAIGALISSILGCTCIGALVGLVLGVVVLVRGRDGRNHGKGLAIAAIVLSVLWGVGGAVGGYFIYDFAKDIRAVSDLDAGDCIDAEGLSDATADSVSAIRLVPCGEPHDGEILATLTLTEEQLGAAPEQVCPEPVTAAGRADVLTLEGVAVTQLSEVDPAAGDKSVCAAYNVDGTKLTGRLGG